MIYLKRLSMSYPSLLPILCLVLTAGIFVLDLSSPLGYAQWVLYFIPLLLVSLLGRPRLIYMAAALFALLMAIPFILNPAAIPVRISAYHRLLGVAALWIGAYTLEEKRKVELAFFENEKFRTSLEIMPAGFAILSPIRDKAGRIVDFRYEYINAVGWRYLGETGGRFHGRSRESAIGLRYLELFPGIDESDLFKSLVRTMESGEPLLQEDWSFEGASAEGKPSRWIFSAVAVRMKDGLAVSWMDVTDRKRQEESLAWLASFPELSPNPMVEIDILGTTCYLNPAARMLFPGIEKAGTSHRWLAGLGLVIEQLQGGKETVTRIVSIGDRDYQQVICLVERLGRIRIYGTDVSERIQAEEAFRRKAEEMEKVLDTVPALVWIAHDPECRHITGNHAADEFLRIPRRSEASLTASEEERPKHFRLVKDGRVLKGDELPVQRAARGEVVAEYGYSVEFEDGTVRHLSGNASPLFDSNGRPRGAVSAILDVTERKKMDEELKAALAEKELLLRELSHRTKNNLQMIINLLGMQATKSGEATLVRAFAEARHRIRTMALVYEKLYRSRSISSLNMKEFAEDLVESLLKAHQGIAGPVGLALDLEDVEVPHDGAFFGGLILNELVSNSLKHAFPDHKPGTIFLSIRRQGNRMELRYRDDGPGMPGDFDLSHVETLGLKLVHRLAVRQLRGTMEIMRRSKTEFVFRFPL